MLPEDTVLLDKFDTINTLRLLAAPHSKPKQKRLLVELKMLGRIGDDELHALFTLLDLGAA